MNQSIISRMNLVIDIEEPDEKILLQRVSAITGFNNTEMLERMSSIIKDIQRRCHETMITDGCCGMRELIAWVQSYMITGDLEESALYTILSSASSSPESREELYNTCIAPKI